MECQGHPYRLSPGTSNTHWSSERLWIFKGIGRCGVWMVNVFMPVPSLNIPGMFCYSLVITVLGSTLLTQLKGLKKGY